MAPKTTGKGFPMAEKLYVRKGVTSDSFYLANEEMHILNGGSTYLVSLREKSWLYVSTGGVAERSSGGLDDCASAGAWDSSFLHDDLSFGRLLADSMAAGAASALDSLQDSGQSGWQNIAKLA